MSIIPKAYYIPNELRSELIPLLWPNLRFEISQSLHYLRPAIMQYEEPIVEIVDRVEAADFLILPYDYFGLVEKNADYLEKMIKLARESKKKLLIFDGSDYSDRNIDVPSDVCVVFRVGMYRHHQKQNEIAMPYYVLDFGEAYGVRMLQKAERCTVSFCGWALPSAQERLKILLKAMLQRFKLLLKGDRLPLMHDKGILWRNRAIRALSRAQEISFDAILRTRYMGHKKTAEMDPIKAREEYVENMAHNLYALSVRGDSNASQRFYEALSFARPALLVDTDCVLPLEECIAYEEIVFRVQPPELREAGTKLAAHYANLSSQEVEAVQAKARQIFLEHLRPPAFFALVFDRERSPYKHLLYV